jgi:hypothetical protein
MIARHTFEATFSVRCVVCGEQRHEKWICNEGTKIPDHPGFPRYQFFNGQFVCEKHKIAGTITVDGIEHIYCPFGGSPGHLVSKDGYHDHYEQHRLAVLEREDKLI